MKLKIKYANQTAQTIYQNREKPLNWKEGDSGIDVSYVDIQGRRCKIPAGGTGMVKTGIMCQIDGADSDLWEIQVRGRSGNNSKGILTHIGDRIAQLVVCPIVKPEIVFVDGLEKTDRGEKGFGSSGK